MFESIRIDPSEIFLGVRTNVWAALAAVLLGLLIMIVQTRRHPGLEPSPYVPGREWAPEAAVDSGDAYTDADDEGTEALAAAGATGSTGATSGVAAKPYADCDATGATGR